MKNCLLLLVLLLAPALIGAEVKAVLVFADDESQVSVLDGQGKALKVSLGMTIPPLASISTKKSTAELQIVPSGSILKLNAGTSFRLDSLKDLAGAKTSSFTLGAGKIRVVVAKLAGTIDPTFFVKTQSSVCGVRGTDFVMEFNPAGQEDWVCVWEGAVNFTQTATQKTVAVGLHEFANTYDTDFKASAPDSKRLDEIFSDVNFHKLVPKAVPGHN